eukprot:12157255-Alexandrium_andersonii.AAC.1
MDGAAVHHSDDFLSAGDGSFLKWIYQSIADRLLIEVGPMEEAGAFTRFLGFDKYRDIDGVYVLPPQ